MSSSRYSSQDAAGHYAGMTNSGHGYASHDHEPNPYYSNGYSSADVYYPYAGEGYHSSGGRPSGAVPYGYSSHSSHTPDPRLSGRLMWTGCAPSHSYETPDVSLGDRPNGYYDNNPPQPNSLSEAITQANIPAINEMLKQDPSIINTLIDGETPLSLAAMYGDEAVVQALLAADGIDLLKKNAEGKTPAEVARYNSKMTIYALLTELCTTDKLIPAATAAKEPINDFETRLNNSDFDDQKLIPLCRDPITHGMINDPIVIEHLIFDRKSLLAYFKSKGNPTELTLSFLKTSIRLADVRNAKTIKPLCDFFNEYVTEQVKLSKPQGSPSQSGMFAPQKTPPVERRDEAVPSIEKRPV